MKTICEQKDCVGCGACYAICPFDAIEMRENELGAIYPQINEDKCKNCNKCYGACPAINDIDLNPPSKCYAAYTKDELDKKTVSSGGIATTIGKYIVKNDGVVFGTIFNKFAIAQTEDEVNKFKGSKYVYLFPDKIYADVHENLLKGKEVLFVGTPCQVAGLKGYLQKDYENLITIDLICHGVPPYSYLDEWLKHTLPHPYHTVSFRGERDYYLTCYDTDMKIMYSKKQSEDAYFHAFLQGIIHRENCYSCRYAKIERVSDITIGDFWKLDSKALNSYAGKKSVILINTDKGEDIFNQAKSLFVYEERDVNEAIHGNDQLSMPTIKHAKRTTFTDAYKKKGFVYALRVSGVLKAVKRNNLKNKILYLPRKMKKIVNKRK